MAFIRQQALSCLFPGFIFLILALTSLAPKGWVPRYDALLLLCLAMQWVLYRCGMETKDELKVIAVFHGIGLGLEAYKTHLGCWSYPEAAWSKIGGVPLYSGFMYASVASYLCQAWRRFRLELSAWPSPRWTVPLALAIYGNFFTEYLLPDARWLLLGAVALVFRRTDVSYVVGEARYRMPLLVSFALIGFFLWTAENIATFFGAWQYPDQHGPWRPVSPTKITSWGLLVIVSFVIVAHLKRLKEHRPHVAKTNAGPEGGTAACGEACGGGWRGGRCTRRRSGTWKRW